MTTTELPADLAKLEGQTIHVLAESGLNVLLRPASDDFAFPPTVTLRRGDSVVLTEPILAASRDRFGRSWLLNTDMTAEQRWAFGPFPADEEVFIRGSEEALHQADIERGLAWRTLSGPALADALKDIERRLGRTGTTSTTLRTDGREAIDQHESEAQTQRRLQRAELQRQAAQNSAAAHRIELPDSVA